MRKSVACLVLIGIFFVSSRAFAESVLPFHLVQDKPVVVACIQGKCGHFLVDFGAPGQPELYLRKSLLDQLTGVKPLHRTIKQNNVAGQKFQVELMTVNGFRLAGKMLNAITIAKWVPWGVSRFTPKQAKNRGNAIKAEQNRIDTLDGVIGLRVFERFSTVTLDYANRRFLFSLPRAEQPSRTEAFRLDANGISVPVKINGQAYRLVLDTGAPNTSLKASHLHGKPQVHPCPPPNKDCGILSVHSFEIDRLKKLKPMILVFQNKEPDYDGILGGNALSKIVLFLDFSHKRFGVKKP